MLYSWINNRRSIIFAFSIDLVLILIFHLNKSILYKSFFLLPSDLFFLISWSTLSYIVGRYHRMHYKDFFGNIILIIKTIMISAFIYILKFIIFSFNISLVNDIKSIILNLILFLVFSLLSNIIIYSFFLLYKDKELKVRNWLFIGNQKLFKSLIKYTEYRKIIPKINFCSESNLDILNTLPKNTGLIFDYNSDLKNEQIDNLFRLKLEGVEILSLLSYCEKYLQSYPPELLDNKDLLLESFFNTYSTLDMRMKRCFDIILSLLLIIITLPIIFTVSLLIFIEDNGSILYSQKRRGIYGSEFTIYKLRTMKVNAEKNGPQWSTNNDSRVTRIGSILRKTRIDELPQLWSVFLGQMSLIGPRPERPILEDPLIKHIQHYRLKYLIRPGISGWAQVNFPYGASTNDSMVKISYDLYYIRNFSFLLDILIFFKTIRLLCNLQGSEPLK